MNSILLLWDHYLIMKSKKKKTSEEKQEILKTKEELHKLINLYLEKNLIRFDIANKLINSI